MWIALRIAPYWDRNIFDLITRMDEIMSEPWHIQWTFGSLKAVLFCLFVYVMGIGIWLSTRRNYRRGEEHGSAKWGDAAAVNRRYRQRPDNMNKILTQNVRIGFDAHKHRRNLNVLVIGGSGAGKTRFYVKPNVMQANCSMVILDPKGEIIRDTGWLLQKKGYKVRVLDLIDMPRSHCYNPFVYLRDDNDVQRLVTNLFKATTPKGATSQDPFWDTAAQMLLLALIFYLKYEAPEEEQNFAMVMEMLRAGDVDEEDSKSPSALDTLFYDLRKTDPDHIALKYYDAYHSGSGKTLKSIQITLAARLEKFNLESVAGLTITDELDLWKLGEEKTALFAIIPDNDTSFNFLVSLLYTQIFQQLFEVADKKYGGSLPVHVQFLMENYSENFKKGKKKANNPKYKSLTNRMSEFRVEGNKIWETISDEEKEARHKAWKEAQKKQKEMTPYKVKDDNYKRVQYVRYADDFLIGVIGSKADAEQIKKDIREFLKEVLKLEMSEEKTKITHTGDRARFLGYDITVSRNQTVRKMANGKRQRCQTGVVCTECHKMIHLH